MALQLNDPSQAVILSVGGAQGGGTANSTKPVITGTADAGDTVNIYDGVRLLGTAIVAPNGTWTFTPTADLKGGTHSFTAIALDSQGHAGASSDPMSVQVGTAVVTPAAPAITSLMDNVAPVTGAITNGTTTNDPSPTLNGTGTAGNTIKLYDGSTLIGSTTVNGDGTWSVKPTTPLSNGAHDVYATQTNSAGTSGHSTDISFKVDTTTPAKPVINGMTDDNGAAIPAGSTTADAHPHISGSGVAGDTVTVYDGSTKLGTTTVDANGKWDFKPSPDLSNGAHDISATDTNKAGTVSPSSDHIAVTVDATTPAAPVITALIDDYGNPILNNKTIDNHPYVNGTGKAGDTVTLYDGSKVLGSAVVDANGKWSIKPTTNLAAGLHDLYATEKNLAGTVGPQSAHVALTIDLTNAAPIITTVTDAVGTVTGAVPAGGTTDDPRPVVSGTGTYGTVIYLYDGSKSLTASVVVTASGTWSIKPPADLSNGTHNFVAWAWSPAGSGSWSSASPTWAITVDTTTPAKPATPVLTDDSNAVIPAGGTSTDGHPHISGTGTKGDTIKIYDGANVIGSTTVDANGKWTFTPATDLSTGAHSIAATETNAAGTTGPKSDAIAYTFALVTAPPVIVTVADAVGPIQGNIPNGGVTDDPRPTVSGTGIPGYTIYLYTNTGRGVGDTTVDATGHWSLRTDKNIDTGANGLYTVQFDATHPTSGSSNTWSVTVDTSTPAKPVITGLTDDNNAGIPAGGTSTDGHPHINGTGVAGDKITVYDGSTALGTATVDANGHWTFTPSTDLATGSHSITAAETNAAGTTGAKSDAFTYTYSTVPTETVTISSLYDDTSGSQVAIAANGSTYDTSPIVKGAVSSALHDGETVVIYRDNVKVGTATVSGTGWTYNDSGVAAGTHTYTARVENTAGNGAFSGGYSFTEAVSHPYSFCAGSFYGVTQYSTGDVPWTYYNTFNGSVYLMASQGVAYSGAGILYVNAYSATSGAFVQSLGSAGSTQGDGDGHIQMSIIMPKDFPANSSLIYGFVFKPDDGEPSFLIGAVNSGDIPFWSSRTDGGKPQQHVDFDNTLPAILTGKPLWSLYGLSTTHDVTDAHDAISAVIDSQPAASDHVAVGEHDSFIGTSGGNQTVDLNVDPATYFKEATAHIEGRTAHPVEPAGVTPAANTLHLTGDHQILDLTSLTGKTAAAKISGIEVIDLGGHTNNLKLSLTDVLNLGEQDLFQKDGKQQLMVNGSDGDKVDLSNAHIAGVADGQWQQEGTVQVGGVTYNVYEHSGAHTELLVQQGVQIALHN